MASGGCFCGVLASARSCSLRRWRIVRHQHLARVAEPCQQRHLSHHSSQLRWDALSNLALAAAASLLALGNNHAYKNMLIQQYPTTSTTFILTTTVSRVYGMLFGLFLLYPSRLRARIVTGRSYQALACELQARAAARTLTPQLASRVPLTLWLHSRWPTA